MEIFIQWGLGGWFYFIINSEIKIIFINYCSRGQLGHGDLEDYNEPKLIEALAGLQVVQIAAAGWHNAVVTSDVKILFFLINLLSRIVEFQMTRKFHRGIFILGVGIQMANLV